MFTLLLVSSVIFVACGQSAEEDSPTTSRDINQDLLGTWETVEYSVDYATYLGGDTSYAEKITEADWGRLYGVKPPSTVFTPDGKLRRTHRLRDGQVVNTVNGLWKAEGDSLLVIEPNITYSYFHEMIGDRLKLSGLVDQDRDGQRDDTYSATFRLVSRTR